MKERERFFMVEVIQQSQSFNQDHRVSENQRILYGYRDGGRRVRFDSDGRPATPTNREIIVVRGPQEDDVLRRVFSMPRMTLHNRGFRL